MLNIGIVDDSKMMCDYLNEICKEYYQKINLDISIDNFFNGNLLLESKKQYDIIFLDVELGIDNGIEIAKRLRKRDKQVFIVVVSGYEKYKKDAFTIHCFDYLDKPITKDKIYTTLGEIQKYREVYPQKENIILKTLQGTKKIYLTSILYCEYKERKVFIHTLSQSYELYVPLSEIYEKLKDKNFGMCHRAFIVNFEKISLIKNNEIIIDTLEVLPLSKMKRKEFLKQFENYLRM